MARINHKMMAWVLLVVVGLYGAAWAAEPEAPALKNPETLYTAYVEQTDGSENGIFLLLDQINDEGKEIEEYGALMIHQTDFDAQGEAILEANYTLQNCDYGRMMIGELSDYALAGVNYVVEDRLYATQMGELLGKGENSDLETLDYFWEVIHFPCGPLETLNGIRQDDGGYTYLLVRSDEESSFEFVVDSSMKIKALRMYARDESGDLVLNSMLCYSLGEAKPIPENVRAAIEEDFAGNNS